MQIIAKHVHLKNSAQIAPSHFIIPSTSRLVSQMAGWSSTRLVTKRHNHWQSVCCWGIQFRAATNVELGKTRTKRKIAGQSSSTTIVIHTYTCIHVCFTYIYIHSCEFMHVYTISFIPCQTGRLKPLLRDVPDSIGRLISCNVCVRINNTLHLFWSNLNGIIKTVIQCIPGKIYRKWQPLLKHHIHMKIKLSIF